MFNSFDFQIFQLGMMGTSVIYSSGDNGVAGYYGTDNSKTICQNSKRMSWAPTALSCLSLTFTYEDKDDLNGTVFNPTFPVRANLIFFIPNDALFYFRLRVLS